MKGWQRVGLVLLALWAVLSIWALAHYLANREENYEFVVLLGWQVLILNFPISVPLSWFISAGPVGMWCWFTFAGFVQWALVVPATANAVSRCLARRPAGN